MTQYQEKPEPYVKLQCLLYEQRKTMKMTGDNSPIRQKEIERTREEIKNFEYNFPEYFI